MPDLEESYASYIHPETTESGLYKITNTPWIAKNTRSTPIEPSE